MADLVTSSTTPTYDYSMIGSVGSEAAQSVNGEMINKIRAAEEKDKIDPITQKLASLDPETEKLAEIKTKIADFKDITSYFDIYNDENVFEQYLFDTSGTSAAFDSVNMSELREGTVTVNVTQVGQKDVYQSEKLTAIQKDTEISFGQNLVVGDESASDHLSVQVGAADAYKFTMYNLNEAGDAIESKKTYQQLADEINAKDELQASLEAIGTDGSGDTIYRLVIKSNEPGVNNALTITQNGFDNLGFGSIESPLIEDNNLYTSVNLNDSKVMVDGVNILSIDNDDDMTLEDVVAKINSDIAGYDATFVDNRIKITNAADGSEVDSVEFVSMSSSESLFDIDDVGFNVDDYTFPIDSSASSLSFADTSQTLKAQNMQATIDGVEYDVSSNSITTQGSLKITGLTEGISTITISKDSSAVTVAAEAIVSSYNDLVTMLNDEIYSEDSPIDNKDALKQILSDVKNMLFASYGAEVAEFGTEVDEYGDIIKDHSNVINNNMNLFIFGFGLDEQGNLSVDTDIFNSIVNGEDDNYDLDDLKNVFTGSYENKGVGVQLKDYLDALDGYKGLFYEYDLELIERKEDLEKEKEDELELLDTKYGIMAEQFSAYSSMIAQMESSFNGLKMMIEQASASNS